MHLRYSARCSATDNLPTIASSTRVWLGVSQLRGIIVENTFTNLTDMVRLVFPFLRPLMTLVTHVQRLHMDNISKVKQIETPTLFISGEKVTHSPIRLPSSID